MHLVTRPLTRDELRENPNWPQPTKWFADYDEAKAWVDEQEDAFDWSIITMPDYGKPMDEQLLEAGILTQEQFDQQRADEAQARERKRLQDGFYGLLRIKDPEE